MKSKGEGGKTKTPRAKPRPGMSAIEMHRQPRQAGKLAEEVAAQIEADIVRLGWPVGQVIGSEATLLKKYGVSRAVFREAIRLIEYHMVARMRAGRGGGLVVVEPNTEIVARAVALYLSYKKVVPKQLLKIRALMEGHAASFAAVSATERERLALREFLATETENIEKSFELTKNFHLRVAELAHNPVIYIFVRCLVDLSEQHIEPMKDRRIIAKRLNAVHTKIGDAIISGDAATAGYRMSRHVQALDPWIGEGKKGM